MTHCPLTFTLVEIGRLPESLVILLSLGEKNQKLEVKAELYLSQNTTKIGIHSQFNRTSKKVQKTSL